MKYSNDFLTLFIRKLYLGGPYEQVKTFSGLGRYSRNSLCWRRNEVERSVEGRIDEERCVRGRIDEERSVGGSARCCLINVCWYCTLYTVYRHRGRKGGRDLWTLRWVHLFPGLLMDSYQNRGEGEGEGGIQHIRDEIQVIPWISCEAIQQGGGGGGDTSH